MDRLLFKDRVDAGGRLAGIYDGPRLNAVVLGIARGGVAVGYPLALGLGAGLDVVTARKLPIPWSPEMGFGAVAPDGSTVLNRDLLKKLRLSSREIDLVREDVLGEVRRRQRVYRGDLPPLDTEGRNVILVDDGLATGYTMIASIRMARNLGAFGITVAVPVSPADTARKVEPMVDGLVVIHVADSTPFAVASFYEDFHDMSDGEVLDYLRMARRADEGAP